MNEQHWLNSIVLHVDAKQTTTYGVTAHQIEIDAISLAHRLGVDLEVHVTPHFSFKINQYSIAGTHNFYIDQAIRNERNREMAMAEMLKERDYEMEK